MKTVILFAAALASLANIPSMSQQTDLSARQSASSSTVGYHVNESSSTAVYAQRSQSSAAMNGAANESAVKSEEMRPVNTELVGKLDTKSAKVGDRVAVKTTETTKTADGTVIPKGTRLVGHVTSVQPHGAGSANSQMAIQFDRAELKSGQGMAIHSEIRSVSPPASATMADTSGDEAFGGPRIGGGSMGGNARISGGGRAVLSGATGTEGRLGTGVVSTANGNLHESSHAVATAVGTVNHANPIAGAAGNTSTRGAVRATGVHGVMLAGGSAEGTSGTLSATKQNVHLESGTQMVLGVSPTR